MLEDPFVTVKHSNATQVSATLRKTKLLASLNALRNLILLEFLTNSKKLGRTDVLPSTRLSGSDVLD